MAAVRIRVGSETCFEAARGAWISFAAAFDPLMFGVKHSTPRGEPLHPCLPGSYVDARVSSGFMLRLVDIQGALDLLKRTPQAPLVQRAAFMLMSNS